ncbi:hypothetical protein JW935_21065 [candidate division KSB1 bacterium]|nr:hypothetical protein [candidate division KSB1 bacterium]
MTTDKVWLTALQRDAAVLEAFKAAHKTGVQSVLFVHFKNPLDAWKDKLSDIGLDYTVLTNSMDFYSYMILQKGTQAFLGFSYGLPDIFPQNFQPVFCRDTVFISLGHHPLYEVNNRISTWVRTVSRADQITYYASLDEPFFKHLGGDRIMDLMKMLKMGENDVIEHPLITNAITKAQRKMKPLMVYNQAFGSAEEWYKYHRFG